MKSSDPSIAQMRLRQTRGEFRMLFVEAQTNDHFPRSATMKWLLSGGGQRVVGYVAGGSIAKLVPHVGGLLRVMPVGLLVKKLWSQINRR